MTPHRKPRQVDRVLRALRHHPTGIDQTMFQPPHVWDGGDPILRLAPRILELKQAGHNIAMRKKANQVAVYRLVEADEGGQTRLPVQEAA